MGWSLLSAEGRYCCTQVREFKADHVEAEEMPINMLLSAQPKEFNQDSGLRTSEVPNHALPRLTAERRR